MIKEYRKAREYFDDAIYEFDDKEMYKSNVKDLVRYLSNYNFSIDHVLGFYSMSDLQDEYDILRLMHFIHVVKELNELENYDEILYENSEYYLVIADEDAMIV